MVGMMSGAGQMQLGDKIQEQRDEPLSPQECRVRRERAGTRPGPLVYFKSCALGVRKVIRMRLCGTQQSRVR